MSLAERNTKALHKKARRGFTGYPLATVAYYGPDAKRANKVAVTVLPDEGRDPVALERWYNDIRDIRRDHATNARILEFIRTHGAVSVLMTDGIVGCPHEEGTDYPQGEACPRCPYWADRDRWAEAEGAGHDAVAPADAPSDRDGGTPDDGAQDMPDDILQAPCPCGSGNAFGDCCGATRGGKGESVAARVAQEMVEMLKGQDFDSIEEAQAFLDERVAERNHSGLDAFDGLSPSQMHLLLNQPFESPPLATLEQHLPDALEAPVLALFGLLADAARARGIKLTARGNLPLKLVKAAAAWLNNDDNAPRTRFGGISTERDVVEFHHVRIIAEIAGLLRKSRGYLYLTRRAEKMLDGDNRAALYRRLLEAGTKKFNWAYRDGYDDLLIIQQSFAFTLYLLHRHGDTWNNAAFYENGFIRAFPMALDQVDPRDYFDAETHVRCAWTLRSLQGFGYLYGLVELAGAPWTFIDREVEVRAMPLLPSVFPHPPPA